MQMSFYVGAIGARNCTEKLSVISNNLANVNATGYKAKAAVFSELISYNLNDDTEAATELRAGAGMRVQGTATRFDTSAFTDTGSEYDYAITDPHAFFMVQDPMNGEISYTRNGNFLRGTYADGYYLVTKSGKLVLDQNQEPIELEVMDPEEAQAAMEEGYERPESEATTVEDLENIPRVSAYYFANPSHLLNIGDNEFVPADAATQPVLMRSGVVMGRALESSSTNIAQELTRMIECQRAFSYAVKMITTSDEITGTINGLRG